MKKPYQALIFDWDGTLADSTSMIVNAVQQAFVENDFAMPSDSEASHIIGLALPKAMQHLAPKPMPMKFLPCLSRTNACF